MNQATSISAALAACSAFPLLAVVSPKPHFTNPSPARSHHKVTRSGREWDRWLQGFQLANGDDALSIALTTLQFAQAIKDPSERAAESDWWTDVVAQLRTCSKFSR